MKHITTVLLAMLALAACDKDDESPAGGQVDIRTTICANTNSDTRATIAPDGSGTFDTGDELGLYAYVGSTAKLTNSSYKVNQTTLFWDELSTTDPVTFSAHYPRITGDITNPAAYLYMPQAWNNTDDLLHATATASKGGTVALTFKHLMHRLVIKLIAGDGMTGTDLSSALINSAAKDNTETMSASVEVNLLTGAVNYDQVAGGVVFSNGGGAGADWIVAPQDLTAGAEWLRITVGEDVWYYHVPADLNPNASGNQTRLESGKQLTLTLTLKKNPGTGNTVTLTSGEISGWGDSNPIDGNIDLSGSGGAPTSGDIDVNSMASTDEVKAAITAALYAGFTEIKLTGELSKTGIGGNGGTFVNNKKITKCDLTGVTGWDTTSELPDIAFMNCTALQEVKLPDGVKVIGGSAFSGCAALTTVNLSQVTWINLTAFWGCTSLETLALDNVTAIGRDAFYGCTGLKTLKIPKCTRFGNYIVTGCRSLTRIEATAAGNFVDISDGASIEEYGVFYNRDDHTGDNAFNPAKCDLVLNADKKQGGGGSPTVSADNGWTLERNNSPMQWKSISFAQQP